MYFLVHMWKVFWNPVLVSKQSHESRIETDWAPVAHIYNSSYLGGWEQEDQGFRPDQANNSWDPISKITTAKWTGGETQVLEDLLCKCEGLSSNPSLTKKKNWDCSSLIWMWIIFAYEKLNKMQSWFKCLLFLIIVILLLLLLLLFEQCVYHTINFL
jgi:hypothetical protein